MPITKKEQNKKSNSMKVELSNKNKVCERDDCEAIAYDWNYSNGDTYCLCPFHWYEGFAHDIDALIRDCWPINWKLTKGEKEVIGYIRREVNGFLSEVEREYELFSNIKKTNKKLQKMKKLQIK